MTSTPFNYSGAEAEILVSRRSPETPATALFPAVSEGRNLFIAVAFPEHHAGHDGAREGSVAYQWADEPNAHFVEYYFQTKGASGTYEYYNFNDHGITSVNGINALAESIVSHHLKQPVKITTAAN